MPDYQQPNNYEELTGLYWYTVMLLHRVVSSSLTGSPERQKLYQLYEKHAKECAHDHTRLMATKNVTFPIPDQPNVDPLLAANGIEKGRHNFIEYLKSFQ